jgi:hypothetical protein
VSVELHTRIEVLDVRLRPVVDGASSLQRLRHRRSVE